MVRNRNTKNEDREKEIAPLLFYMYIGSVLLMILLTVTRHDFHLFWYFTFIFPIFYDAPIFWQALLFSSFIFEKFLPIVIYGLWLNRILGQHVIHAPSKIFCTVLIVINLLIPDSHIDALKNPFIWMEEYLVTDPDLDFFIRRYDFIVLFVLLIWSEIKKSKIGSIGVVLFHWIMFQVVIINLNKYYTFIM